MLFKAVFNAVFFSAPHRVMFLAGALQSVLTVALWSVDLGARYAGLYTPLAWPLPPLWMHSLVMIYGLFSFFVFGFLMTALPKWVGGAALTQRLYLPPFLLLVAGWGTFYLALIVPVPILYSLLLIAAGWGWGVCSLVQVAYRGANTGKHHAWAVLTALGMGVPGVLAFAMGIERGDAGWVRIAIELGVWCSVLPVFFIVSHRMLPFFSSTVIPRYTIYRSLPVLWVMLGCFAAHALGSIFNLRSFLWPLDALAAGLAFFVSWKWQVHRSFVVPLLAMHHVATLWLGVGLALYAGQGALAAFGFVWGGLAPLHALTIGYFASMLLGMATRVTLGHSGRTLDTDRWTWGLFWAFQGVVVLRLAGEFLLWSGPGNLVWLASIGWLLVFGLWCRIHLPFYLKPRPDGQAG
jgi:uncharacterized protein involved in response to NO